MRFHHIEMKSETKEIFQVGRCREKLSPKKKAVSLKKTASSFARWSHWRNFFFHFTLDITTKNYWAHWPDRDCSMLLLLDVITTFLQAWACARQAFYAENAHSLKWLGNFFMLLYWMKNEWSNEVWRHEMRNEMESWWCWRLMGCDLRLYTRGICLVKLEMVFLWHLIAVGFWWILRGF